jgi:membrane-associated phospholipid phosphatase
MSPVLLRWTFGIALWAALLLLAFRADRWIYVEVAGRVAERTGERPARFGRPEGGRSTGLTEFLHLMKRMGHFYFTILIAVTMLVLAPARRGQVLVLVLAVLFSAAVGQGLLKPAVAKLRPDAELTAEQAARHPTIVVHGRMLNRGSAVFREPFSGFRGHSGLTFPSGHTTLAFATFAVLGAAFPRGRRWFLLLACGVGASRVLMGEHFLSDVVAGAGIGYACARVVLARPRLRRLMAA